VGSIPRWCHGDGQRWNWQLGGNVVSFLGRTDEMRDGVEAAVRLRGVVTHCREVVLSPQYDPAHEVCVDPL
jgi:hypothetical protein